MSDESLDLPVAAPREPAAFTPRRRDWAALIARTLAGWALGYHRLEVSAPEGAFVQDKGIVEIQESVFGALPTEMSPDPRVIVLFADLGQFKKFEFDGFFNVFDQMTEKEAWEKHQQHSNEANIIYINGLRSSETYTQGVISHELQHLLTHHGRPEAGQGLENWLSESIAEGAMLLTGYYTDQGHVNRYAKSPWQFPLVSPSYVQYGPQILFASYLFDQLKQPRLFAKTGQIPLPSKRAVEAVMEEALGVPQNFDAIFSQFLSYIFGTAEKKEKIPGGWRHYENTGLTIPAFAYAAEAMNLPFDFQGTVMPYAFAPIKLPHPLPMNALVRVSIGEAQEECRKNGSALWKPLSSHVLAVYVVGCTANKPSEAVKFQLSIFEVPEMLPRSPLRLGL
ncbi:MAG: hypothetical protein HUU37_03330 [Bdellovibrionales bacterium]|nr:hypothetical protein [Bdellovibrionales bacterium]